MQEFFARRDVQVILLATAFVALVVICVYVLKRFRNPPQQSSANAHSLLANFREMHAKGELSDEEFRTIKSALAAKIQQQVKDSGKNT